MILFAIKEYNTGLFITLRGRLEPLGDLTRFFKSRSDAMRAIEYSSDDFVITPILDDLVWQAIEADYGMDRWSINIDKKEFKKYRDQFIIGVCKVELQEIDEEIY